MVLRGFYEVEHMLVIDILIRKIYMTEEDIEELIKFEKKQLRNVITQLKNEKILKARIKMETGPDKKSKKQNYYYINYRGFVNVVKYKLDHMRRKIETEERDNTTRASFICTQCKKTYTDLEADQLCDLTTGEFRCNYCGDIVEEESSALPKADSRLVLAKFNQQIEPLYLLLKEVEDLKLPAELLEPEPIDSVIPGIKTEIDDPNKQWNSIDRNRGINSSYENMLLKESSMTVKIEESSGSILDSKKDANSLSDMQPKKERPSWLVESTIYDENSSSNSVNKINGLNNNITIKEENDQSIMNYFQSNGFENDQIKDSLAKEILEALMIYEKPDENSFKTPNGLNNGSMQSNHFGDDFSTSKLNGHHTINNRNGHSSLNESDNYEFFKFPQCHVNGKLRPINQVNEDCLKLMNQQERDEFVKISSEIYNLLYD